MTTEGEDKQELSTVDDLIKTMEDLAESYPFVDPDFNILVIEGVKKPFLIIDPDELDEWIKRTVGEIPTV